MDFNTIIQKAASGSLSAEERTQFFNEIQTEFEKLKAEHPEEYLAFVTNMSEAMSALSEGLEHSNS